MRRLIPTVVLACAALSALAADVIEKGAEDLLQNKALSQPFNVFDQLLLSLDRRANDVAKQFRPEKNDYRPIPGIVEVFSSVLYEKSAFRTTIGFSLYVSGIDDPWRDVCAKRVKRIAYALGLPDAKNWEVSKYGYFPSVLGPRLTADRAQLDNYRSFSDSIVVGLKIMEESGDRKKPLKHIRECFLDNKTGLVSFREHKY